MRIFAKTDIGRERKLDEDYFYASKAEDKIKLLQDKGFSAKDISVILSELYQINKNKVYKFIISKQM